MSGVEKCSNSLRGRSVPMILVVMVGFFCPTLLSLSCNHHPIVIGSVRKESVREPIEQVEEHKKRKLERNDIDGVKILGSVSRRELDEIKKIVARHGEVFHPTVIQVQRDGESRFKVVTGNRPPKIASSIGHDIVLFSVKGQRDLVVHQISTWMR